MTREQLSSFSKEELIKHFLELYSLSAKAAMQDPGFRDVLRTEHTISSQARAIKELQETINNIKNIHLNLN